jgi:hypothetical protein
LIFPIFAALWALPSGAAIGQAPPVSMAPVTQDWTTARRHFSFSGIVFDITYGYWRAGGQAEPLADCSDARTYCLSSPTFSVALPKSCADLAAGRWSVGNVRTEVVFRYVASSPPLHGGGSDTTLYLGSPLRPHQLFLFDPSTGLRGLYWDARGEVDFIAMARQGQLESWLSIRNGLPTRLDHYFPLTTLATVGECRGRWQDRFSRRPN